MNVFATTIILDFQLLPALETVIFEWPQIQPIAVILMLKMKFMKLLMYILYEVKVTQNLLRTRRFIYLGLREITSIGDLKRGS